MTKQLNWGILATGRIARTFATHLAHSSTGRLVAVASRTAAAAEKFAADFGGIRAHGSYDALLADPEVEVVYIATPHPSHLEWTLKAAAAGKHILCEKPIALNGVHTARMIEAAKQHGVFLMEAFMYRCHPQTAALVELVRGGSLGELRLIQVNLNLLRPFDAEHRLFNRTLGGGGILDLGCYPASFSRLLAGAAIGQAVAEPVEFKAVGRVHPQTQTDEYATAVAKFPGGVMAELSCGMTVRRDISARLFFTGGRVEIPAPFFPGLEEHPAAFTVYREGAAAPEVVSRPGGPGLYAVEADTVAGAIARGERESSAMSHADTLGNMVVLDRWRAQLGVVYDGED